MTKPEPESHISRISTIWSLLHEAHRDGDRRVLAQSLLVECYGPAVRRYLFALTRDHEATDELWQRFMTSLVEGAFRHAAPEKGRFRAYVKTSLFHLVSREHRQKYRTMPNFPDAIESTQTSPNDSDRFDELWRSQMLDRAWSALEDAQPRYYRALKIRVNHPDMPIDALADLLNQEEQVDTSSETVSAQTLRKLVSRARDRFSGLLLDEVARSIEPPTAEHVESELADLGLLEYCRTALESRRQEGPAR